MDHSIKLNRAFKQSGLSSIPSRRQAILLAIPESAIAALTSAQLSQLIVALHEHWQNARLLERSEILAEGSIWDGSRLRLIA